MFTKDERSLIIRIAHENIRRFLQSVSEIDWLQYLSLQNYPTRLPTGTKQGEFFYLILVRNKNLILFVLTK